MNRDQKLLLSLAAATVAVACTAVAVNITAIETLVNTAMNRTLPRIMEKSKSAISGSKKKKTQAELDQKRLVEDSFRALGHETVTVKSHDGLRLVGHLCRCVAPRRVIIAMHGWRSNWAKDFSAIAPFWQKNGCIVLYPEQRGQGSSEGDFMSFGLLERHDVAAWVGYIIARTGGKLPIYLAGVSMGATTVMMASGMELPAQVKGVIADCGFTSPHAIWRHVVSDNLHFPYDGANARFADRLSKKKIAIGTKDYSTTEALSVTRLPLLFIHGTADTFVPVEMTYENYLACRSKKRLLIVPGAAHAMSYVLEPEKYEEECLRFWKEND